MDDNSSRSALPLSSHGQAVGPHRILEEEYSGMDSILKVEQSVPVSGKVLFLNALNKKDPKITCGSWRQLSHLEELGFFLAV